MAITRTTPRASVRPTDPTDPSDYVHPFHGARKRSRRVRFDIATAALAALSACASAQTWRFEPSAAAQFELTDNVGLDPSGQRKGDLVTQLTPSVRIIERGAHTSLAGTIAAPIVLYARSGGDSTVQPEVDLNGTAELYRRLLFIDGSINVAPSYFSPFGARPQNLTSATANRYTARTYRISPYLKGDSGATLHYELRDDNTWASAGSAPSATDSSYTNKVIARVTRDPTPLGWALDYTRDDTRFSSQDPLVSEIERLHGSWLASYQWEFSAAAGYEDNRYPLAHFSDVVYGVGFKWRPTDRTTVDATWEHRFFGGSYHVTFDHRTALSVWSVRATRDITTYPQQLANLVAGTPVATLLDSLFASRFPDPLQRQTYVDQLIRDRGLPSVLSNPLALYSQQTTLEEAFQATFGLLGARNTVFFTAYRNRSEPIASGTLLDAASTLLIDNTQRGANVVWTHKLTPLYTLTGSADWSRTTGNEDPGRKSTQTSLNAIVSASVSPLTQLFGGARYQRLRSDVESSYDETAVFVGISHRFR
jgi:uncharacterized protein (PEP-CTERM system associated)